MGDAEREKTESDRKGEKKERKGDEKWDEKYRKMKEKVKKEMRCWRRERGTGERYKKVKRECKV